MPLVIPPFVSYQAPMFPVAANWQTPPPEGPRFVACEIDWGYTAPIGRAVQFTLSSGPVEFSQICAFSVDNGRCGADVSFIMPDTGKQLTVPAGTQGLFPVFTNSMTFYVVSDGAISGDVTVFEILNAMPPPVAIPAPVNEQSHVGVSGISLTTAASTPLVPTGTSGTLTGGQITFTNAGAAAVTATASLQDGVGNQLWAYALTLAAGQTVAVTLPVMRIRFVGLNFVVASPTGAGPATATVNVYYSQP